MDGIGKLIAILAGVAVGKALLDGAQKEGAAAPVQPVVNVHLNKRYVTRKPRKRKPTVTDTSDTADSHLQNLEVEGPGSTETTQDVAPAEADIPPDGQTQDTETETNDDA